MYESTRQQIKRLLIEMVYHPNLEQRTSTLKSIEALLDRFVLEVKSEEERKASEIIDEGKRAMWQEVMKGEARQIIVDAISGAVKDQLKSLKLESAIGRIVTTRLTKFLLEKNLDNRVDARLEDLMNMIKSREKRESFLPGNDESVSMYECLSGEIRGKMPVHVAIHKCRKLVDYPLSFSLGELKKIRRDVREALSELKRWRCDDFVHISDLEKVIALPAQKIDEELSKVGFLKFSRRLSDDQEVIYYYIPVERSCLDDVKKVEEGLVEKIQNIEKRISDLEEEERKRRIEEYRRAEMISRPY